MVSSIQKSNARLAIYTAPVAIYFLLQLATGGAINLPTIAVLSSIQGLLGKEGFTFLKETLTLLGSGGVNLLTGEAHERFKDFLKGFQTEKLLNDQKFQETIKKTIIYILNEEKDNPALSDQKQNIEKLINALEKNYEKTIELKTADINQEIQQSILDSFFYEAEDLARNASPLTANEWKNLLEDVAIISDESIYEEGIGFRLNLPNDFQSALDKLAESLEQNFPKRFQNFLEKDLAEGGETFAKFVLDFLTKINNSNDEIKRILAGYKLDIEKIKQNTSQVLLQGQENQTELTEFLNQISLQIDNLQKGLDSKPQSASLSEISIANKEIKKNFRRYSKDLTLVITTIRNLPSEVADELERRKLLAETKKQRFYPKNFPQSLIYFTGREQVLENIAEALKNHGTAAFADTHGVGKSSVVIEFAYRQQETYKQILFIRATNNEFNIYVSEIVKNLGFNLPEDAKPEPRLAVLQDWLAKNQDWLLLVDNVDDVDFIHKCEFNKPNGKVIYTSNDEKIFRVGTRVQLPKLNDENAMLLLYKHWQDDADAKFEDIPEKAHPALKGIAEKFGNHPFSMAFVGSYLAEEDESLEEFLEAYQSKEKNLLEKYKFLSGYQHENVAAAFLLRFEQISTPKDDTEREQFLSIAVKDYLKLSAFVGTDNIPEELLQQSLAKLHPDQAELTEDKDFLKDIYKRFKPTSIFKRDVENKTLSTQRIIQEIMCFQIKDEENLLLETLAQVLESNFESFKFTNIKKVERYLLHVGVFLEYLEKNKTETQENLKLENKLIGNLCNKYGWYFDFQGQYNKAEKYAEYSKNIYSRIEDIDQELLAESYHSLARIYRIQAKYELSESLFLKAIEIRENTLGRNHKDTASSYNSLAVLYDEQGKYELAELLYKRIIKIYEESEENKEVSLATTYHNLANLYESQWKYDLAKLFYSQSIEILEKIQDEYPHFLASSYSGLSSVYYQLKNNESALFYCQKSIVINEQIHSKEHPNIARNYNALALIYGSQGKYELAESYLKKSVEIIEKALGENHPDVVRTYNNLASFYRSQGKYQESDDLYVKSKEKCEKLLGENHPETANSYNNLAFIYQLQGRYEESEILYIKSKEIYEKILGKSHPETARSYLDLGEFYCRRGKTEIGLELCDKALKILENNLPSGDLYLRLCHSRIEKLKNPIPKIQKQKIEKGKLSKIKEFFRW